MEESYDYIEHEPQNIAKRKYEIFKIAFRGNDVFIKLVDSVQLDTVSFVSITIERYFEKTYHVIKTTFSKFKKRGLLKYIFSILLFDFGFTIMSDNIHTIPGSMNFWKAFKKLENTECRIVNMETKYNRQYIDQLDTAIWGLNGGYFTDDKINGFVVDSLYSKKVICDCKLPQN